MSYPFERNQSKKLSSVPLKQMQQEPPIWKSPTTWFCAVGAGLLISIPLLADGFTPRLKTAFVVDVSLSNQPYKASLAKICQKYIEHLVEGDTRIEEKFADKATIVSNQKFQERDRLSLQNQCQQINLPPPGIGKIPGTSLVDALSRLEIEIKHYESQGDTQPTAAIIAIDSAEFVNREPQDFNLIKSKIEGIVQKRGAVAIIGSSIDLQNQLSHKLMQIKNTQICSYADSETCVGSLFETARK